MSPKSERGWQILDQDPARESEIRELGQRIWPRFMQHGNIREWDRMYSDFSRYQIFFAATDGKVEAVGLTIPTVWSGRMEDLPATLDSMVWDSVHRPETPNTLCALAALVPPSLRGQGYSPRILTAMRTLVRDMGMDHLIAPVRPTWKERYPTVSIERYANWRRADLMSFDPWLRVHDRLGGTRLGFIPESYTVEASVAEWEEWTGRSFPDGRDYIVSGALVPVSIDRVGDVGRYVEPNVWYRHDPEGSGS